jgi:ATP-dependent DNA helicase RecG
MPQPMPESQTLEWKTSWRDDHLKWVCGFANAEGGTLVIGRNDAGKLVIRYRKFRTFEN